MAATAAWSAARAVGSSIIAADSAATASSDAVYVLVAAIASSGPADRSSVQSARSASGDDGSLVRATVGAPCRLAASTTATMSGDAPDWLTASTRARRSAGSAP